MKLAEKLLNLLNEASDGDWAVFDYGKNTKGKQFSMSVYHSGDGWLPVPQIKADSEKEAEKLAMAYAKKYKLSGKQLPMRG